MKGLLVEGVCLDAGTAESAAECLFCSRDILNSSCLLTPDLIQSIPVILNFHPANILNWNKRLLQTSFCPDCYQTMLEGSQLTMLLEDLQRKLTHISTSITNAIRKSSFVHSAAPPRDVHSSCSGAMENPVSRLRHDLAVCMKLEPFPPSLENHTTSQDVSSERNRPESNEGVFTLRTSEDVFTEHVEVESPAGESDWDRCLEEEHDGRPDFDPTILKRTRNLNFTEEEVTLLLKLYEEKIKVLTGDRGKRHSYERKTLWDGVAKEVSAVSNTQRTGEQCRRKIININNKRPVSDDVVSGTVVVGEDDSSSLSSTGEQIGMTEDLENDHDADPTILKRTRNLNFTEEEVALLLKLYEKKIKVLPLPGDRGKRYSCERKTLWNGIAKEVSAVSNTQRTGEQCRRKIININNKRPVSDDVVSGTVVVGEDDSSSLSSTGEQIGMSEDWENDHDATLTLVSLELEEHGIPPVSHPQDLDAPGGQSVDMVEVPSFDEDPAVPRRGRVFFTDMEVSILLSEFERNKKLFTGRCSSRKKIAWVQIANKVSAASNIRRSAEQCRKKIENLKYSNFTEKKDTLGLELAPDLHHNHLDESEDLEVPRIEKIETLSIPPDCSLDQKFNNSNSYVVTMSNGSFRLKNLCIQIHRCDDKSFQRQVLPPPPQMTAAYRHLKLKQRLKRKRMLDLSKKGRNVSLRCVHCPSTFKTSRLRAAHVSQTHPLPPPPAPFTCPVAECTQEFARSTQLELHIRHQHGGEFQYFCDHEPCAKGFFTLIGLQNHASRCHDESVRKFSCDLCPAKCLTRLYLNKHKAAVHEQLKPFICEVCGVGFKTKAELGDHQGKFHGSLDPVKFQPERQTCPTCGFICGTRTYLRRHMMSRHSEPSSSTPLPIFNYVCTFPNCSLRFDRPSAVKKHILFVHSEEKNFQCHLCPKAYKDCHRLNYHLKRHDGVADRKCPHCPKFFANTRSLFNHIQVIHNPNPGKIKCEDCGEGFPIRKYYHRHRAICAQGFSGTAKKSTPKHIEARRRREGYI